ncbi:MAG: 2Fe-2S iron-sulfur cluster-binding protein [Leisingera sp.]
MSHFHSLAVADVRPEIGGAAASVTFSVPEALRDTFDWQAGQHLTLRYTVDGKEHRRCYSISSPPGGSLRITVKRVQGGVVSNHIAEQLAAGSRVEVTPPAGRFVLRAAPLARRTHYFFGAGSGITPLYAMISAVLEQEPHSAAHLIYGNSSADSILFRDELEALAAAHPDRFTLRHVLSAPSLWSWFSPWRSGRIDAEAISAAFAGTPPVAQDVRYWICGPGSMNTSVRQALMGLDVPDWRIHMESFGGAVKGADAEGIAATAAVILNGARREIAVAADQTLLEAALAAGLKPPHSCQSGVCGACKARLTAGRVRMRAQMALEDSEVAGGQILCCQAVAETPELAVAFEG